MTTSLVNHTIFSTEPTIYECEFRALALHIIDTDIERMEHYWNENPMCDFYSKNAICSALNRLLRKNSGPTRITTNTATTSVRIGDTIYPLSHQITEWFTNANRGLPIKPFSSIIWLPRNLISRRLLKPQFKIDHTSF